MDRNPQIKEKVKKSLEVNKFSDEVFKAVVNMWIEKMLEHTISEINT